MPVKERALKLPARLARFKRSQVADVLEALYAHEINLFWGWTWDGGMNSYIINGIAFRPEGIRRSDLYDSNAPDQLVDAIIGLDLDGYDVAEVVSEIAFAAAALFPGSSYSKWYSDQATKKR